MGPRRRVGRPAVKASEQPSSPTLDSTEQQSPADDGTSLAQQDPVMDAAAPVATARKANTARTKSATGKINSSTDPQTTSLVDAMRPLSLKRKTAPAAADDATSESFLKRARTGRVLVFGSGECAQLGNDVCLFYHQST